MANIRNRKIALIIPTFILFASLVLGILFLFPKTYTAANITVAEANGVTVYVSGAEVEKTKDGYSAPAGAEITVTVVNEDSIFEKMTINGTEYVTPVQTLTISEAISISVETQRSTASARGAYFGNPFIVDEEEDLVSLSKIFRGEGISDDYARFDLSGSAEDLQKLQYGYFRLTANLMVNSGDFIGIGSATRPFQGCFDFNGYNVYLNISKMQFIKDDFYAEQSLSQGQTTYMADFGFFGYIYGDGTNPCLIRNADVRGGIAINTTDKESTVPEGPLRINGGGIAGRVGKNVVLDQISSQVTVSAQVKQATLSLGGLFGYSSASVDSWSEASYTGLYGNISGITSGENADVYVGGLAGLLQNAYVNRFEVSAQSTFLIANSIGKNSGLAAVGGLAGIVYIADGEKGNKAEELSDPKSITLQNIKIGVRDSFSLSSVVDNKGEEGEEDKTNINPDDFMSNSSGAVSGGLVGVIYRAEDKALGDLSISLSHIEFTQGGNGALSVSAQTQNENSVGIVFSGGLVGYLHTGSEQYIRYLGSSNAEEGAVVYIFDCNTEINSLQNGYGPAYAGGLFGYNAFKLREDRTESETYYFRLTDSETDFDVSAVQAAKSKNAGVKYEVCSGFYSSKLQPGYSIENLHFIVEKATVTAKREAGSHAVGDIAAGGLAGKAGENSGGNFKNIVLEFTPDVSVNALGYSFDSHWNGGDEGKGNNVYAGGFIGYIQNYTVTNLKIDYNPQDTQEFTGTVAEYSVQGVQNAKVPGVGDNEGEPGDYKSEGYVGGMFGMFVDSTATGIRVLGNPSVAQNIYFTSSNNPNTACVGGLIGATRSINKAFSIDGGEVRDMAVIGRAYSEKDKAEKPNGDEGGDCDLFAGGAIGVFGSDQGGRTFSVTNIYVYDTVIQAIGEKLILTYAGGVFGGIWYEGIFKADSCASIGCSVEANSIEGNAYAAGISGQMEGSITVSSSYTINTTVRAETTSGRSYASGTVGRIKSGNVTNNYSNASLSASTKSGSAYCTGVAFIDNDSIAGDIQGEGISHWWEEGFGLKFNYRNNFSNNYFVAENAFLDFDDSSKVYALTSVGGKPIKQRLIEAGPLGGQKKIEDIPATYIALIESGNTLTNSHNLSQGGKAEIFSHLDLSSATIKLGKNSEGILSLSGHEVTAQNGKGVVYASVVVNVNGTDYSLCTYPIIVNGGTETPDFGLFVENEEDFAAYVDEGANQYVRVNVGDPNSSQNVIFRPENEEEVFPSKATIYAVKPSDINSTDFEKRLTEILENLDSPVQPSYFNGQVNLQFIGEIGEQSEGKAVPYATLDEDIIIVVQYTVDGVDYNLVMEFIANEPTEISVTVSDDTPALGTTDDGAYIFSAGDTVRFEATVKYKYSGNSFRTDVIFSAGDSSYEGIVKSNGMVFISDKAVDGTKYTINCSLLGGGLQTSVHITVRSEISVYYDSEGANVSSDRKAVTGSDYHFTLTPQPGYGLLPTLKFSFLGEKEEFSPEAPSDGSFDISYNDVTYTIEYTFNSQTGAYAFTLPSNLMSALSGINIMISPSFPKVYTLAFSAEGGAREGGTDGYYTLTVEAGRPISELVDTSEYEDLQRWIETLSRDGFDLRGFYLTSNANSLQGYGTSFADMLAGDTVVNGAMMFYARWTYNVVVEAPEGVEVESGLSDSLVQEGLIPIDDKNGFAFIVSLPEVWSGDVNFDLFVMNKDGTFECITDKCVSGDQENMWVLSAEALNNSDGIIYLVIYADSLEVSIGDTTYYDGDQMYEDGIFSLEYYVNYGNDDIPNESVTFNFEEKLPENTLSKETSLELPKDTSLRLYYYKDGSFVWSGNLALSEAVSSVSVKDFLSMKDGSKFSVVNRAEAKAERFRLVVTLPNNEKNFNAKSDGTKLTFSVNRYVYKPTVTEYGEYLKENPVKSPEKSGSCAGKLTLYPVVSRSVKENGTQLTYNVGTALTNVTDYRHEGLTDVWAITTTDGRVISEVDKSTIISIFGGSADVIVTTTGIYCSATSVTTIDVSGLNGYTVSLLEARNLQYPAAGAVLWSKKLS